MHVVRMRAPVGDQARQPRPRHSLPAAAKRKCARWTKSVRVTVTQLQGFNVFANYETKTCNGAAGAASNAYCLGSYADDADGSLQASWVSAFCG